jgi:hypothetical protein
MIRLDGLFALRSTDFVGVQDNFPNVTGIEISGYPVLKSIPFDGFLFF